MKKILVGIVDDSALVRQVMGQIIQNNPEFELLFTALDPIFAMDRMKQAWPDVIILDVEMPRMDGISFLKKIMSERPTPVIICSTLTQEKSELSMEALSAGAVEVVAKPLVGIKNFLDDSVIKFTEAIRTAASANVNYSLKLSRMESSNKTKPTQKNFITTDKVIAIGTSAGGTIALEYVLSRVDRDCPGIIAVQHMPEKFTKAYASRLNQVSQMDVKEAEHGDRVIPGTVLIAPGSFHMSLVKSGAQYRVEVKDGPLVSRHRPSVDVLFRSVAKSAGENAIGIIMTGMGDDGANGLLEMKQSGAITYAQNEESCVVFGMPKEAIKRGAVDKILPLDDIPHIINRFK
ncbi:MAG: chemotaxis response regulator protein-glutamate methylesterase [Leptospiraceae bacterium]|nr:chemotaxis response regulator protein-glutamate methylesterase [Leptospiraceae bacterium]